MKASWLELVTLGIALLGAVLGVLSTWRSYSADRVRIKVRESLAQSNAGSGWLITIDVVNLSTFPVTITHIGFDLLGTGRHMQMPLPRFTRGESLPVRLEPRAAFTVLQPRSTLVDEQVRLLSNAYVTTACGHKAKGKGSALSHLALLTLAAQ